MATIDDLPNKPLSEMSEEEMMQRILALRHERRVNLDKPKQAKPAASSSKGAKRQPKQATMNDVMMTLANDQASKLALLAMLEKELKK